MKLSISNLTKKYGNVTALDGFSFEFSEGIYGILGANGAGKSTLMNLITDNVRRDGGSILYDGKDILELGAEFRGVLGYMPQQQGIYEHMTAESFVSYMARLKGLKGARLKAEVERVLNLANLSGVKHKKTGQFSGGMKQRVLLAQALLNDPKVLILDEPTAGLDPRGRDRILGLIKDYHNEKKSTVMLVSHSMEDVAKTVSKILVMNDAKVFMFDTPEHVFARVRELDSMGLTVPQITRVFDRLKQSGINFSDEVYSVEYAKKLVLRLLDNKSGR